MTRGRAIALGLFTLWPFVYAVLFMSSILFFVVADIATAVSPAESPDAFLLIFPLHLLTMLEILVLQVIYVVYLFGTDRVRQDKKALWAAVLILGNMIAMPVFWYLYVWRRPDDAGAEVMAEQEDQGDSTKGDTDLRTQTQKGLLRQIVWNLYAWPLTLMLLVSSGFAVLDLGLVAIADAVLSIPSLIALHLHIWDKRIPPSIVWKVYAFAFLAWQLLYGFFLEPAVAGEPFQAADLTIPLFMIPLLVALFRYAFRNWNGGFTPEQAHRADGVQAIT